MRKNRFGHQLSHEKDTTAAAAAGEELQSIAIEGIPTTYYVYVLNNPFHGTNFQIVRKGKLVP